jgi:hypothetical protein
MSYWREAKQILEWRSEGFLMSPADTFAVELINVTGDNAAELVVSVMTSEGMGMGVQSSDIFVIDRQKNTVSAPITVEDYGRVSGFYGKSLAKPVGCYRLLGKVQKIKRAGVYMLKAHGIN